MPGAVLLRHTGSRSCVLGKVRSGPCCLVLVEPVGTWRGRMRAVLSLGNSPSPRVSRVCETEPQRPKPPHQ